MFRGMNPSLGGRSFSSDSNRSPSSGVSTPEASPSSFPPRIQPAIVRNRQPLANLFAPPPVMCFPQPRHCRSIRSVDPERIRRAGESSPAVPGRFAFAIVLSPASQGSLECGGPPRGFRRGPSGRAGTRRRFAFPQLQSRSSRFVRLAPGPVGARALQICQGTVFYPERSRRATLPLSSRTLQLPRAASSGPRSSSASLPQIAAEMFAQPDSSLCLSSRTISASALAGLAPHSISSVFRTFSPVPLSPAPPFPT
jgi:hypothetical protein